MSNQHKGTRSVGGGAFARTPSSMFQKTQNLLVRLPGAIMKCSRSLPRLCRRWVDINSGRIRGAVSWTSC